MTVRIEFTSSSRKEFQRLPDDVQRRFGSAIDGLAAHWPSVRGSQARRLVGSRAWRLRVGADRAIFEVDAEALVFTRFGHRSVVYRV